MLSKFKHVISFRNSRNSKKQITTLRFKASLMTLLIVSSFIVSAFAPILQTSNVSALAQDDSDTSKYYDQIASYLYYESIVFCMQHSDLSSWNGGFLNMGMTNVITQSDSQNGKWFDGKQQVTPGVYMNKDYIQGMATDGSINCGNTSLIKTALDLWTNNGASGMDATSVLCGSGFKRIDNSECNPKDIDVNIPFARTGTAKDSATALAQYIRDHVYKGGSAVADLTSAQLYILYQRSLSQRCVPGVETTPPQGSAPDKNPLKDVNWADTSVTPAVKKPGFYESSISNLDEDQIVQTKITEHLKCQEIANRMSSNADAYILAYNKFKVATTPVTDNTTTPVAGDTITPEQKAALDQAIAEGQAKDDKAKADAAAKAKKEAEKELREATPLVVEPN